MAHFSHACLEKLYQGYLNEIGNLKRETNHAWLQNFTGGDLNENIRFNEWELMRGN